jgi:hypothetical protein
MSKLVLVNRDSIEHLNVPKQNVRLEYQVWRSTDSCGEFYSWDDADEEDYLAAHPTARRKVYIET